MSIDYNHPLYHDICLSVEFMRDSIEGEYKMKEFSQKKNYLRLPASSMETPGLDWEKQKFRLKNRTAYINDAEYPEVVSRSIDFAVSTVLSSPYKIDNKPDLFTDEFLDKLDSDGRTFYQLVQHVLREQFSTPAQALLVDTDPDTNQDIVIHYSRENIVNWKTKKYGMLNLIVFEGTMLDDENVYSHDYNNVRISFHMSGPDSLVVEKFKGSNVDHTEIDSLEYKKFNTKNSGKNNKLHNRNRSHDNFDESIQRVEFSGIDKLPVFVIGDLDQKSSIFSALANSCLSYFKRSAELNHALHWAAMPQPYVKFTDEGKFYGTEGELDSIDHELGSKDSSVTLEWGSPVPWILKNGDIKFAQVNNSGIPFILSKLDKLVDVIAGTGARAFSSKIGSNITAETQRLQQYSENSIISMHVKMVEDAITKVLRHIARINDVEDYQSILFSFSKDTGIDDFNTENIKDLISLFENELISKEHIWEYLRIIKYISESETNEEVKEKIEKDLQDRIDGDLM